jgi:uncharacterized protein (DUF1697 family)
VARYAAFLRGINVGGRRVRGPDLCAALEGIGLGDVASVRASGNLVFSAAREPVARLQSRVEEALEAALGYDVAVFLRTPAQLRAIAAHDPFPRARVEASAGKLQVSLLARPPSATKRKAVLALATERDTLVFGERELYWLPPGPLLESELDLAAIDRLLGPLTCRTMGTIELMAAKYFAD